MHYYQRAAEVAARTFAHDESIRLHERLSRSSATLPRGPTAWRGSCPSWRGWPLRSTPASATPPPAPRRRSSAPSTSRTRWDAGTRRSPTWSRSGRRSSSTATRRTAHRTAARALALVESSPELSGAAHFAYGGSALGLGRPAEAVRAPRDRGGLARSTYSLSVGTRPDVHGRAWAAHAHWLLGDPDRGLAGAPRRSPSPARSAPRSPSPWPSAYGAPSPISCAATCAALADTSGSSAELCDRYSFAYYGEWAPVLAGWLRRDGSGTHLARRGIDRLTAGGSLPHAVLAVPARRPARPRRPPGRGAGRPSTRPSPPAQPHDDVWWLPEVLRLRAGYDQTRDAASRGSARPPGWPPRTAAWPCCRRCDAALRARERSTRRSPFPRRRDGTPSRRTLRERCAPSVAGARIQVGRAPTRRRTAVTTTSAHTPTVAVRRAAPPPCAATSSRPATPTTTRPAPSTTP